MDKIINGSTDDKRGNLEIWNEQKRLADDYCLFLDIAIREGFKVEVILVVDGQIGISTAMLNPRNDYCNVLLREMRRIGEWERVKIDAILSRYMVDQEKVDSEDSP